MKAVTAYVLAALLMLGCAATPIRERCRLITEDVPVPEMAPGFNELDRVLMRRVVELAGTVRGFRSPLNLDFKEIFAESCLPELCERIEAARRSAVAGRLKDAGGEYQVLLVASQILAIRVAVMQGVELADAAGQPSWQIDRIVGGYEQEMISLWNATLTGGPEGISKVLKFSPRAFERWLAFLDRWTRALRLGEERVRIAQSLWSMFLVAASAYDAAGSMAELAASARPPPGLGALVGCGAGAPVLAVDQGLLVESVVAIQKLIASGALDPVVVAAMARMEGGSGAKGTRDPPPQGGACRDVAGNGAEAHHMPSKRISPLSEGEGPAIRMTPDDHQDTPSWGNSKIAQAWRARQKELIDAGKFGEAQQMDIDDIRARFGSKYDQAIKEMLDYTRRLPPQKLLPQGAK